MKMITGVKKLFREKTLQKRFRKKASIFVRNPYKKKNLEPLQ